MDDERSKRIQEDMEKLERAGEEHDWASEIIDDAIGGLVSPLTHEDPLENVPNLDEPEASPTLLKDREREKREAEERLNEVW
jgi:hypothetical protein